MTVFMPSKNVLADNKLVSLTSTNNAQMDYRAHSRRVSRNCNVSKLANYDNTSRSLHLCCLYFCSTMHSPGVCCEN